jgi:hypothetical protein
MEMPMHHGHAAWNWTRSMITDKQHGQTYSMDMDIYIQYGHGHAASTWKYSINMDIQH